MSQGFTLEEWDEEVKTFWEDMLRIMTDNNEYIRCGHSIYEVRRHCARVKGEELPELPKRDEDYFRKLKISQLQNDEKIIQSKINISPPSKKKEWREYLVILNSVLKDKKQKRMRRIINRKKE